MAKKNNVELKIKDKFLINIQSRPDEKKEKFTKWLSAQNNPQNSFLSLVEHCIDRFGYADIMEHEISKKLHTELVYSKSQEQVQLSGNIKNESNNSLEIPIKQVKINEDENEEKPINNVKNEIKADLGSF